MSEKLIKGFVCEKCGRQSLKRSDFYGCIVCGRMCCGNNKNCTYHISVRVDHNIPNGIPYLHTKAEYRICKDCLNLSGGKPIPEELYRLLLHKKHGKLFRKGDEDENEWIFIDEKIK